MDREQLLLLDVLRPSVQAWREDEIRNSNSMMTPEREYEQSLLKYMDKSIAQRRKAWLQLNQMNQK